MSWNPAARVGAALAVGALALAGCGATSQDESEGAREAGVVSTFADWVGEATVDWGVSTGLNALFGIGSQSQVTADFNQVQTQLTQIQTQLSAMQTQLNQVNAGVTTLEAGQSQAVKDMFAYSNNALDSAYTQVINVLELPPCATSPTTSAEASPGASPTASPTSAPCSPPGPPQFYTPAQLAASPSLMAKLSDALCSGSSSGSSCDTGLKNLWDDSINLVGVTPSPELTASPTASVLTGGSTGGANQLFVSYQTLLSSKVPTAGSAGTDIVPEMVNYNNQVMYTAGQSLQGLQQAYNLQYLVLYLQCSPAPVAASGSPTSPAGSSSPAATASPNSTTSCNGQNQSPFANASFPIANMRSTNSFAENLSLLNQAYGALVDTLGAQSEAAIITDNYQGPTANAWGISAANYPAPNNPNAPYSQAKTSLMPGGAWTSSCNLYIYPGSVPSSAGAAGSAMVLSGSYTGASLSPFCYQYQNATQNTASTLIPTAPVNLTYCTAGTANDVGFATATQTSTGNPTGQAQCAGGLTRTTSASFYAATGQVNAYNTSGLYYSAYWDDPDNNYTFEFPSAGDQQSFSFLQANSTQSGFSPKSSGLEPTSSTVVNTQSSSTKRGATPSPNPSGSFAMTYQLNLPNGYIGPIYVSGTNNGVPPQGDQVLWTMYIGCNGADPMCAAASNNGSGPVCVAGYPLSLAQGSNSATAVATLGTPGSCTVQGGSQLPAPSTGQLLTPASTLTTASTDSSG